ncbi:tail assembly chaperone [Lactococcus taiwanensis]|uniref:Tail assembly chaperone n=1 Tax=Lactococcus taiwanensis TaxID=1151742 RepID=A0AA45KFC3_9LACT|nr:tail assembly chaperone [Lactococcus taiwanensis]QSE76313.1 tail assembly chaperone [Lactococcus taiwanensis]
MELTINDKQYGFKFGVKFVRELDKTYPIMQEGIAFGMGLTAKVIPELKSANVNALATVLYLANRTETPKLSQGDIDNYIDDCEDIEQLFDDVLKELAESNAGKIAMKTVEERVAKAQQAAQNA